MKVTLGELDRFWAEEVGDDWYVGEDSDESMQVDEEWEDSSRVVDFKRGSIVAIYQGRGEEQDAWDPYQEFVAWRKHQKVDTLVVEVARENRDQLAAWLAEHGGRIVVGAR